MSTTATTTARRDEDRRKSRKGIIGLAAMATAGALVVGLGFAYFSDTIDFGGSATAGTLDIKAGTLTVTQDGAAQQDDTPADTTVSNFNPGDTMELSNLITNVGNKSAHVRTTVGLTGAAGADIANYLYVYAGESAPDQATLMAAEDAGTLTTQPGYVGKVADLSTSETIGTQTAEDAVIAGGAAADNETTEAKNGDSDGDGAADAANDANYNAKVVVYFAKAAGNEAQGETAPMKVVVQALQYRNNTAVPAEAGWDTVVTTAFGN